MMMACLPFQFVGSLNAREPKHPIMATFSPKLPSQFGDDRKTQPPSEISPECEKRPVAEDELLALVTACRDGNGDSCTRLAKYHLQTENSERALPLARKGCELGDASGCAVMGVAYVDLNQMEKAQKLLTPHCSGDAVEGCSTLGASYYKSGREKEAVKSWEKGCQKNDGTSCGNLGTLYFQDAQFENALTYWRKGCSLDSCGACENLKVVRKNPAFPSEIRASMRN